MRFKAVISAVHVADPVTTDSHHFDESGIFSTDPDPEPSSFKHKLAKLNEMGKVTCEIFKFYLSNGSLKRKCKLTKSMRFLMYLRSKSNSDLNPATDPPQCKK